MPFFRISMVAVGFYGTKVSERHTEEAPDFDTALRRVEDYYPSTRWETFYTEETEGFIDGQWIAHHLMDDDS